MVRSVVVEIRGELLESRELGVRNTREIMVLIVVANIPAKEVTEPSVVREGLVALEPLIVLSNVVAGHGVQTTSDDGAQEEVEQGIPTHKVKHKSINGELDSPLEKLSASPRKGLEEKRADGVGQGLDDQPDQFHERSTEDTALPQRGNVRVHVGSVLVKQTINISTIIHTN
jgi:hypothetical protein